MSDPTSYSKPGTQDGVFGEAAYENVLVTEDKPLPVTDAAVEAATEEAAFTQRSIAIILEDLLTTQENTLKLLEAVFEDGISGRDLTDGDF